MLTAANSSVRIPNMNTERLVETLIRRQVDEGWSDREMGRQLGVNHTTWRGVKIGRHGPGVLFIQRTMQRFPEYLPLLFVPSYVSDSHQSVTGGIKEAA